MVALTSLLEYHRFRETKARMWREQVKLLDKKDFGNWYVDYFDNILKNEGESTDLESGSASEISSNFLC